jgi:hypothetical protein
MTITTTTAITITTTTIPITLKRYGENAAREYYILLGIKDFEPPRRENGMNDSVFLSPISDSHTGTDVTYVICIYI